MKIQTILATSIVAASLLASSAVFASSYSGNVAVNSNYIFRGQTQSDDQAAISGGIDWNHSAGGYIGGWTSNLGGGEYELDLYGGYVFSASKVDVDVGYIAYIYPVVSSSDYSELYANATINNFTAGLALTISKKGTSQDNDIYIYGTGEFELKKDLNLAATIGYYNYDDSQFNSYGHVQVALLKDDFTFAIDKNGDDSKNGAGQSLNRDEVRFTVGYSKSIDF